MEVVIFPSREIITAFLLAHWCFEDPYWHVEDRATPNARAIAESVADAFANKRKKVPGIHLGLSLLGEDLKNGVDGFTGKPIFSVSENGIAPSVFETLWIGIDEAMIELAEQYKQKK